MIVEAILLGLAAGLVARWARRKFNRDLGPLDSSLDFRGLGLTGLAGLAFLALLRLTPGTWLEGYFGLLQGGLLILMGLGLAWGRPSPGKLILGLGLGLNGLVILINGKMPVDLARLADMGQEKRAGLIASGRVLTHKPLGGDRLAFLADRIAYKPLARDPVLMSLGDIMIALGLALCLVQLVLTFDKEGKDG